MNTEPCSISYLLWIRGRQCNAMQQWKGNVMHCPFLEGLFLRRCILIGPTSWLQLVWGEVFRGTMTDRKRLLDWRRVSVTQSYIRDVRDLFWTPHSRLTCSHTYFDPTILVVFNQKELQIAHSNVNTKAEGRLLLGTEMNEWISVSAASLQILEKALNKLMIDFDTYAFIFKFSYIKLQQSLGLLTFIFFFTCSRWTLKQAN